MRRAIQIAACTALLSLVAHPGLAQEQSPTSAPENATPAAPPPPPVAPGAVDLDHVVAVIGTTVILQSDVDQEMRFAALEPLRVLPGEDTPDRALRRLIDRTLILEQMKEQQQSVTTDHADVVQALTELRRQIPACHARYHCETQQGWDNFLAANQLTESEVEKHWSQRMAILQFIDLRFRSGIRITPQQIADYYNKVLVPALEKHHETAPPLKDVSARIQEILLQQQVSGLFRDWLASLRDQGNVRVVDSAYGGELDFAGSSAGQDQSE